MKTRIVKKNHKELLKRRGKGFYGRVLPVMFDTSFMVVQGIPGRPRSEAIIRYMDFKPTDTDIFKLQQLFLKKYNVELAKIISVSYFCGAQQGERFFERELEPVNKQVSIEFA